MNIWPFVIAFTETLFIAVICHFSERYKGIYRYIVILLFLIWFNAILLPTAAKAQEIDILENSITLYTNKGLTTREMIQSAVLNEKMNAYKNMSKYRTYKLSPAEIKDYTEKRDRYLRWTIGYWNKVREIEEWSPFRSDREEIKLFFSNIAVGMFSPNATGIAIVIVDMMIFYGFRVYEEFEDMERYIYKFEGYRDLYLFYDALLKIHS
jgi:hypothetical protein